MPERLKRMCLFIIYIDKNGPFLPHLQCCVLTVMCSPWEKFLRESEGEKCVYVMNILILVLI